MVEEFWSRGRLRLPRLRFPSLLGSGALSRATSRATEPTFGNSRMIGPQVTSLSQSHLPFAVKQGCFFRISVLLQFAVTCLGKSLASSIRGLTN
jgi:hypothetical protein